MRKSYWLFMLTFALVFYSMGASFVESFVNYRTWHLIGAGEFRAYHQALTPLIVIFLVIPGLSNLILLFMLLRWRPSPIPLWSVWLSIALAAFIIVVSVTLQIPIQMELDEKGLSIPLLNKLILQDWLRKVPATITAVMFLWMMSKVLKKAEAANGDFS